MASLPPDLCLELVAFVAGLSLGSFLNVLALRSLAGVSVLHPPSKCPDCLIPLKLWQRLPLISYLLLKGRCSACGSRIHWQYPFVELFTGVAFVVLFRFYSLSIDLLAMAVFVSTLVAVTITDFRAKLIPHDITYPSMLLGLLYSGSVRHDLAGALAGVGASYIIFDFLAHYGLKVYLAFHKGGNELSVDSQEACEEIDSAMQMGSRSAGGGEEEEVEVMGGGDAVLAAVISAWLGWQRLAVALVVAFLVGTLMGMIYMFLEMHKQGILKESVRPALLGASAGFALMLLFTAGTGQLFALQAIASLWLPMSAVGLLVGGMLGVLTVGTRVSKPFPFGPALAAGGLAAVLLRHSL